MLAQKNRNNKRLLAIKNINKTLVAKVIKILNIINLKNKYGQAISNDNININKNLRLTNTKKYQRCIGQIQDKVDRLNKNWIFILIVFVKYF